MPPLHRNKSDLDARSDKSWAEHEHTAGPSQVAAQRLVDAAGSVDLAKQALNNATEPFPKESADIDRDAFATKNGYSSYLEMFEAAEPVQDRTQSAWLLAASGPEFIVWNEREFAAVQFASRDEAMAAIDEGRVNSK